MSIVIHHANDIWVSFSSDIDIGFYYRLSGYMMYTGVLGNDNKEIYRKRVEGIW